MKSLGWQPALLAVFFHLQLLYSGGAVKVHRGKQPAAAAVAQLRQALSSRTEELQNQKNIAHGLSLEVRELQSELQAEKKAMAAETQKEHIIEQKLNNVRAVLDDGSVNTGTTAKAEKGLSTPVAAAAVPVNDVESVSKPAARVAQAPPTQPAEATQPAEDPDEQTMDKYVSDSEVDAPAEMTAQQGLPAPHHQAPQVPLAEEPHSRQPAAQDRLQEIAEVAAARRQTTAQEPPPFFEAAALQASAEHAMKKARITVKKATARPPTKVQSHAVKVNNGAKKAIQRAPSRKPKASRPVAALRGTSRAGKPVSPARSLSEAVTSAAAETPANTPALSKDGSGGAGSDFDALEAQLHEEDRRIQDLDKENALDAMTDGGLPPVPGSTPELVKTPVKAQPKLELDAEEPMADFLNVDAPGPETVGEATPPSAAKPADTPAADAAMAMPEEGMGNGLEGALSDNSFLAQIAPNPRHG